MGAFSKFKQKNILKNQMSEAEKEKKEIISKVDNYFVKNEKLYNLYEILEAQDELYRWLESGKKIRLSNKHLCDILAELKIYGESNSKIMKSYLVEKYGNIKFGRVLVSGVDKKIQFLEELLRNGNSVHVLDDDVALSHALAKEKGFTFEEGSFISDYSAGHGKGTILDKYGHVIGMQPNVEVTENMVRQSLDKKPFDIMLSEEEGRALNGKKIRSVVELCEHLESISSEVKIRIGPDNHTYFATNTNKVKGNEATLEGIEMER